MVVVSQSRSKGVQVTLGGLRIGAWTQCTLLVQLYDNSTGLPIGSPKEIELENATTTMTVAADYTVGGVVDLWGATEVDVAKLLSGQIGISMIAQISAINDSAPNLLVTREVRVQELKVAWSWTASFTKYYFRAGSEDVKADLIFYRETGGNPETGTGTGIMQFANLEPHSTANRRHIAVGATIHVTAGGSAGTKVAKVKAVYRNAPASFNKVVNANSRYRS